MFSPGVSGNQILNPIEEEIRKPNQSHITNDSYDLDPVAE